MTSSASIVAGETRVEVRLGAPRTLSALPPERVSEDLRRAGAVLLRGYGASLEEFRAFTERFHDRFVRYPGRQLFSGDGTVQAVAAGERAIPLHAELCYLPGAPDVCWFHCGRASAHGGETLLADGVAIARTLDEAPGSSLDRPIHYRLEIPAEVFPQLLDATTVEGALAFIRQRGWSHAFDRVEDRLFVDWSTSLLAQPLGGGPPAFINQLLYWGLDSERITWADGEAISASFLRRAQEASERHTARLTWDAGDIVAFDNRRFLHGRRRVTDPKRRIHTRFGIGFIEPGS